MNAFFYPRLALSGMRRDRRIYAPYLAACVFMTAVVYDLAFLADSPALYAVGSGVNGMGTSAIRLVMTLGKWVMAVFALLFLEMSRNVQSGNTQNLKSMVIQRSFPKWSVAERRKTAAASDQAAVCACAHSRYFAGGSPSGLRV